MDDKDGLLEIDRRVRAAVSPPASVVDRVVMRSFTNGDRAPQHRRRIRFAAMTAAMLALLIGLTAWQGRRQGAGENTRPTSLAITGEGSLLVVESQDGRRWVVGPAPKRRIGGGYVIVVPQ